MGMGSKLFVVPILLSVGSGSPKKRKNILDVKLYFASKIVQSINFVYGQVSAAGVLSFNILRPESLAKDSSLFRPINTVRA